MAKADCSKITETEESVLLTRCRKGDTSAIEEMLNRYKNLVRSKANTLYLVGADKEDLIQEGMIGLYKAIREYDAEKNASFATFAQLCVTRQMYTAIKASKRKKNWPLNDYVSIEEYRTPDSTGGGVREENSLCMRDPVESILDREQSDWLEGVLADKLSKMEQQVLALYTAGYSFTQIAQVMEKDPKSIDNALQRLRRKLKTVLAIPGGM